MSSKSDKLAPEGVISTTVQGGSGGQPFDDSPFSRGGGVVEIRVRASKYVDAIQVVYAESAAPKHGGDGGDPSTFTLFAGETVVRIDGRAAKYIDQIQFFTNTGRSSPTYGGNGGTPFSWTVPAGYHLSYFTGRSASYVDALQGYFED